MKGRQGFAIVGVAIVEINGDILRQWVMRVEISGQILEAADWDLGDLRVWGCKTEVEEMEVDSIPFKGSGSTSILYYYFLLSLGV